MKEFGLSLKKKQHNIGCPTFKDSYYFWQFSQWLL